MATSSATAARAFKAALVEAIRTLVDAEQVLVSFGYPAPADLKAYRDAVAVTRVDVDQDVATLSTNRSREETLRLTVVISCWRPGGADQEEVASDAAYGLLEVIERHVRLTDTTVGGTVRHCFLVSHTSDGETDPQALASGRTIEIEAVFEAAVRITG